MAATTNFLQFNPAKANQESDTTYLNDTTRSGGVVLDQLLASVLLNKLWYQSSTFVAALAQALANKGYTTSDVDVNVLAAVLANILTQADLNALLPLSTANGGTGAASLVAAGIVTTSIFPLPVVDGGTGANTLQGAGLPQVTAANMYNISSGPLTTQTLATTAVYGNHRISWHAFAAAGSVGTGLTVTITWTEGGVAHTVSSFANVVSTDGQCSSGSVNIYPDLGTAVQYAQTQSYPSAYQVRAWMEVI